ncbi:MAG TPA: tetratricopeptide repeat protein [Blastocatellia bacterium]|nr:tetratricopeptide repeat protein [Blastocatellia bacterium]
MRRMITRSLILAVFSIASGVSITAVAQAQALRSAQDYYSRGNACFARGEWDGAISDYDRVVEFLSRPAAGHRDTDLSESLTARIRIIDPHLAAVYFKRGAARKAKGEFDEAIADFDRALAVKPRFVEALIHRGNAWHLKGESEKAIADFSRAIALDSRRVEAYNNRGIARQAAGDIAGAIADFDHSIALAPDSSEAWNNRGAAHCVRGEIDAAMADLDRAIALNPDFALAHANRGMTLLMQGKEAEAEQELNRGFALNEALRPSFEKRIRELKEYLAAGQQPGNLAKKN